MSRESLPGPRRVFAVAPPTFNWRRWLVLGAIGFGFAMQAWLRSTRWRGLVVTTSGEALIYRPSAWWLAVIAGPGVLMFLIGIAIATIRHPLARLFGGALLLMTLAFLVAIPATIMKARLVVVPEGFTDQTGFWWAPVTRAVRFDSLRSIRVVPDRNRDREGPPSFVLECRHRDGTIERLPQSDNLKAGMTSIMIRAARRGVALPGHDPIDDGE